jgi:hypothetical protein
MQKSVGRKTFVARGRPPRGAVGRIRRGEKRVESKWTSLEKEGRGRFAPQLFCPLHPAHLSFLFCVHFRESVVNLLQFEYRIGTKYYARSAPIGPL